MDFYLTVELYYYLLLVQSGTNWYNQSFVSVLFYVYP